MERAQAKAGQFGVSRVCSQAELLADPTIDLVVNQTVPTTHFAITMAALRAGKHVWTEHPLGVGRENRRATLLEAAHRGLQDGFGPATVLAAHAQPSRKHVSRELIGSSVTTTAV